MSPTFFFLGVLSFIVTWAIRTLGLPAYCWNYIILPFLSVFFLCDHQKVLTEVTSEFTKPFRGMAILAAALSSSYLGILPLKMVIQLVCVFGLVPALVRAYSFEKMMFMGDKCGELAKLVLWQAVLRFVPFQINKMSWKGDWAYCSPYSRRLVLKNIEFYYTLSKEKPDEARIPARAPFEFKFQIEECSVMCKYFMIGRNGRILEIDNASGSSEISRIREESTKCKDNQGASSSQSQSGTVVEGSSSLNENVADGQTWNQNHRKKLEVTLSLQDGGEELESFTFFPRDIGRVAEIKHAMAILSEYQNLIFSNFHENIGSHHPTAHAKCYEFKDIFELILTRGYTLKKVKLPQLYTCSISGTTMLEWLSLFVEIVNVGVLAWMNFYQLVSAAPHSSLIAVLCLFTFIQLLTVLLKFFVGNAKRLLYSFISMIFRSDTADNIYIFLQRKYPTLTFCNQSYGRPYTQDCRVICKFLDEEGLPVFTTSEPAPFPHLNLFDVGVQLYDLRNLFLELEIKNRGQEGQEFLVKVCIKWKSDGALFYNNHFAVQDSQKISNLIGMLVWLKDNEWQGICKKWWPDKTVMHAFPYKELVCKTLDSNTYYEPMLFTLREKVRISVE